MSVSRAARFTSGPKTSPNRDSTRPQTSPTRTGVTPRAPSKSPPVVVSRSTSSSLPSVSARSRAIRAPVAALSATNRIASPIVLTTRPPLAETMSRAAASKRWTNWERSVEPRPGGAARERDHVGEPDGARQRQRGAVGSGVAQLAELRGVAAGDRGELAPVGVHQLRLEHGRQGREPVEDEQPRGRVVELVPAGHVLDEGLDLPQGEPVGRVPEGAGHGDDGAQVQPVLADQGGGAVDGLGVALGVDRLVRVGVRQAHRGPEAAHDVDVDAGALRPGRAR